MTPATINALAAAVYAQNVERGWWDDPNRDVYRTLQLVNTEIAEATEGDRKDLWDDHLPHRKMVEVELADTLIRLLDLAGHYEWKYDPLAAPDPLYDASACLAANHLAVTAAVIEIARWAHRHGVGQCSWPYSTAVSTILAISDRERYDLAGAVKEKLEFNATRADHSREARAHFDGKKY